MYYAGIALIALIVHIIINHDLMNKANINRGNHARVPYRRFLYSITLFYFADIMWGLLYDQRWLIPTYICTILFFFSMALSVLLWTKSVVAFTDDHGKFGSMIVGGGWMIFMFETVIIVLNFFSPIIFYFEGTEYVPLPARHITLIMQMILYILSSVFALIISFRSEGDKRNHFRIVGLASLVMAIFIVVQAPFPLLPLYSIGCLFATCLIQSLVYNNVIDQHYKTIEEVSEQAHRDPLTGVKNKLAYIELLREMEMNLKDNKLDEYGVVFFDLNGLKMINDTQGHDAGDEYLKSSCKLICESYKHSPIYRIGGDEFIALLQGSDFARRERIKELFDEKIEDNVREGGPVIASGMAVYDPGIDESYTDVFIRAEKRMYERKEFLRTIRSEGMFD